MRRRAVRRVLARYGSGDIVTSLESVLRNDVLSFDQEAILRESVSELARRARERGDVLEIRSARLRQMLNDRGIPIN